MESLTFVIVAFGLLGYALVSGRLQQSAITPPMVFVAFGLIIGPGVLAVADLDVDTAVIDTLAELTLVLVLFTDAARIDLRLLWRDHNLPVRMLAIGMPLTILAGLGVAMALFDQFGLLEAALIAAVLAPTDAALGQAVVSSARVPVRIRQALSIESGLNDGIALPVVVILASFASAGHAEASPGVDFWVRFVALQLVLGPVVGAAVGGIGGRLVDSAARAGWMTLPFQGLSALGLAIIAFAAAEVVGGNGFIAAFVAGLTLGNVVRSACTFLFEFAETEGQLLTLLTFLVFGAVMVPPAIAGFDPIVLVYAVLSLTLIRMVPVAISLIGSGVSAPTVGFLGWFGPRGLASILFALLVVEESAVAARADFLAIVVTTVLLSVVLHGLTAAPGAALYARSAAAMGRAKPDCAEAVPVSEMPTRLYGAIRSRGGTTE